VLESRAGMLALRTICLHPHGGCGSEAAAAGSPE
jgi:hypothetical protein